MDSFVGCLLMEHSVVTKGSPGCQTGAEEIPDLFHMLESFFHENRASRISILEGDEMGSSIAAFHRAEASPGNVISPQKQGFRMFQYEEFRRNF
jgi:hypothetical protein